MKSKIFLFTAITATALLLYTNEFTVPKVKKQSKNLSVKKIKEQTLNQIGDLLNLLLDLDRTSIELRSHLQQSFEAGICGDDMPINSNSKKERKDYLSDLESLSAELQKNIEFMKLKIKKIKSKQLKG